MAKQFDHNQKEDIKDTLLQFLYAQMEGKEPDLDEFVKKYPEFEHQIRERIQKIQQIDALFDTLVKADESDFEDASLAQDLIGRKVGNFEMLEMIGRGGIGVVYLARDTKLDRTVAIKSIPSDLEKDSITRTRFRREAQLLASLNHPNIAVIHDIIEPDEKAAYLILEYVPGETLAEQIARGPLKLQEALSIGLQVAEAVSAAHKEGVVHRDLKPGNIKITPDGKVKVLDFGLAKTTVTEGKKEETTTTQAGHIIGTPAYMSPEQARGKVTDNRTDIWSFGCIMYQMLSGQLPFDGETATDTLARIIKREPDWKLLPQGTPANIRVLLHRCLEKDQDRRLGDITEAAIEIKETLIAPPVTIHGKLRRMAMIIGATVIIVLIGAVLWHTFEKQAQPSSKQIRLIVLPFENQGAADYEYFANNLTEDFTSRLADIHGMGVISHQSAIQYKNTDKSIRQIANELQADYILVGTVKSELPSDPNSRVKIRLRLIRALDDTQVWSEIYDNDLREIFRLQSDVAEKVAQALGISLLESERQVLAGHSTDNMEAYDYYSRGYEYYRRGNNQDINIAINMYEQAVGLDPNLAIAQARLSYAYVRMYWFGYDRSEERLEKARLAAEKALELAPEMPEAYLCMGDYFYYGHANHERALEFLYTGLLSHPNHSGLLATIGYVQRRQGKFEEALENIKKAKELNPGRLDFSIGNTLMILHRYEEAEPYLAKAILLAPDSALGYIWKAGLHLRWQADTKTARRILKEGLQNAELTERPSIINSMINIDVYERKYQDALDQLSLVSEYVDRIVSRPPQDLRCAQIYEYMDKTESAQAYYESARKILVEEIEKRPETGNLHSALGIAYAGLGRKEDAIKEGQLGLTYCPVTKDAMGGPVCIEYMARIYVMIGDYEAAFKQLESLVDIPIAGTQVCLFTLDPVWDPLRKHPRFQKFVEADK